MDELPTFRPDGLDGAAVQTLADSSGPIRGTYVTTKTTLDVARAGRRDAIETLHDASVDFSAQARSRFRKNGPVLETLLRLPTDDQTMQQSLTRGDAIAARWVTLPLVGTPPAEFAVGQGTASLTRTGYGLRITAARATETALPGIDQDFQAAEAMLHGKLAELDDFATAALEQGRSQFAEGTPQREIIDAIPTEPAGGGGAPEPEPEPEPEPTVPAAATFATVSVDGTGGVNVTGMVAAGATSFQVQLLAPGATEFADHTTSPGPTVQFGPLAAGSWQVRIAGINAQGLGPWSAPGSFETP